MKKRALSILMVIAMMAMFLTGCSKSEDKNTSSTPAASNEGKYAVILKNQATDFWITMKEGIEAKAKELGVAVDIYYAASEEDVEGQLSILENLLGKGYDAIGIAPLSSTNLISGVVEAYKEGVCIVNIDEKFDMDQLVGEAGVYGFVTTDNVAVGNKGGSYIVDQTGGKGQVGIIEGKSGSQSSIDRAEGAKTAFEDGGMDIVSSEAADWDRQTALDIASTWIEQYPELKGIYCCNDTMALGALQAVINAGKLGEILVVGTDGDSEAIASIDDDKLSATVAQDSASIGATSLELMVKAVTSGNTKVDVNVIPDATPVDSILVTKENAADYK